MGNILFTIEQLKVINLIIEEKGFKKASEVLCVSQPSVSLQIKNLEKNMNTIFIEKNIRKPKLTYAGVIFLTYTKQILELCEYTQKKINQIEVVKKINFKVGINKKVYQSLSTDFINTFKFKYPNVGIKLEINSAEKIYLGLQSKNLDFGVEKIEKVLKKKLLVEKYNKNQETTAIVKKKDIEQAKLIFYKDGDMFKSISSKVTTDKTEEKVIELEYFFTKKMENYIISKSPRIDWDKEIKRLNFSFTKDRSTKKYKSNSEIKNMRSKYILKASEMFVEEIKGRNKPKDFSKSFLSLYSLKKRTLKNI